MKTAFCFKYCLNKLFWWSLKYCLTSALHFKSASGTTRTIFSNGGSEQCWNQNTICTCVNLPATWALKTCPCGLISKLTYSWASKKSSLRRYLIPSRLQPICPVTWAVIAACSSLEADLTPCWSKTTTTYNTEFQEYWNTQKSMKHLTMCFMSKSTLFFLRCIWAGQINLFFVL